MESLPTEVLMMILRFAGDDPVVVCRISKVCWHWYECMAPIRERMWAMLDKWVSIETPSGYCQECLDDKPTGMVVDGKKWDMLGVFIREMYVGGMFEDVENGKGPRCGECDTRLDFWWLHEDTWRGVVDLRDITAQNGFLDGLKDEIRAQCDPDDPLVKRALGLIKEIENDCENLVDAYKRMTKGVVDRILWSCSLDDENMKI